jgi:hypothetical protein
MKHPSGGIASRERQGFFPFDFLMVRIGCLADEAASPRSV